jgi:hypothetical protein
MRRDIATFRVSAGCFRKQQQTAAQRLAVQRAHLRIAQRREERELDRPAAQ